MAKTLPETEKKGYGVNYLDNRDCFYAWAELGSLAKAKSHFEKNGIVNPKTGKPPTRAAISVAAKRWIAYNLEEAYDVYVHYGSLMNFEEFKRWAVRYVKPVMTRMSYRKWLKKFDLVEYDPEYANSYKTIQEVEQDEEIQKLRELSEKVDRKSKRK